MLGRVCLAGLALALGACEAAVQRAAPAGAPQPQEVRPIGPPVSILVSDGEHPEANVMRLAHLTQSDGRLYSVAGGDPAINGLSTYLAVLESPADGMRVFMIGNFNDWQVLYERPGQVALQVSRSFIDADGGVETVEERMLLEVPRPGDETMSLSMAEAPA